MRCGPGAIPLLLCAAILATGCGTSADSASQEGTTKGPKPEIPQGPSSSRLIVRDVEEGDGPEAERGDELLVHYVAGIYETGEEIESAWVSDNPLGFVLGSGEWMPGWEKGMPGMRVGGRRELIIPTTREVTPLGSDLGDTLVYVVDLVDAVEAAGGR